MSNRKGFSLVLITGIIMSFGITLDSVGLHSPLYTSTFNNHGFASLTFKYPRFSTSVRFYQSWHLAFVLNYIYHRGLYPEFWWKKLYEFLRRDTVHGFRKSVFWLPYGHWVWDIWYLIVCMNDKHTTKAFLCLIKVQKTMALSSFISGCGLSAISYLESLRILRLARNLFVYKCSVLH